MTEMTAEHIKAWLNRSHCEDIEIIEKEDLEKISDWVAKSIESYYWKKLYPDPLSGEPGKMSYRLQLIWIDKNGELYTCLPSLHPNGFDRAASDHPIYGDFAIVGYKIYYLNFLSEQEELIHDVGKWVTLRLNEDWMAEYYVYKHNIV